MTASDWHQLGDREDLRMRNGIGTDECFTHHRLGSFNVTRLNADLGSGALALQPFRVALDNGDMLKHLTSRDIDWDIVAMMTPARAKEPVILLMTEGKADVLDGAHRLIRLAKYKVAAFFWAYMLNEAQVESYRIVYQRLELGIWSDISAQELLNRTWGLYARRLPAGGA